MNQHASKQEQQSQVEAVEVVIGGKVFRKTILPAVTRQDALNKSGGIKNLPKQSRQLTDQEKQVLDESSREGQSAHDRNFSDYSFRANAPQGNVVWDDGNKVNGAYLPYEKQ